MSSVQNDLVSLANAHMERVILEQFVAAVDATEDPALAKQLKGLCELFALSRMEEDSGWFLEAGYIQGNKAKAIRKLVNELCLNVRQNALPLVDAFAIPEEILAAPIAKTDAPKRRLL